MSPARRTFNLAPTPATDRADDWRHDIPPCANVEPELFYVPGDIKAWERPEPAEQLAIVRGLCGPCPHVADCLQGALEQGDKHTFRGNTTPAERDALRGASSRRRSNGELRPCGTTAAWYRHIRAGEKPCDPCRLAINARQAQKKAQKRAKAAEVAT